MNSNMMIRFPGIPLSFDHVPRSFRILGFEVTIFGLLLAASLIIALIIITTGAKRRGVSPNQCLGGAFFAIIGGVVGSRALYVGLHWSEYGMDWMRILNTRDGGMTFYGAVAGSMLFLGLFSLISGSSFLESADILAIGGCFCQAVVRWGDFFNREAFGEYTDLPFAMQLPGQSVHDRYVTDLMREHLVTEGSQTFVQVIPLFLFESAVFLVLFFILTARNRRKLFEGETFYRYLTWCGLLSLPIRFLRTDKMPVPGIDPLMIMGTEADLNLLISAFMFVFFGLILWGRRSMAKKRSDVRREHNERIYQAEEQAEAAADSREKRLEEEKNDLARRTEEIREARHRAEEENRSRPRQPDRRDSTSVEDILAEAEALRAEAGLPAVKASDPGENRAPGDSASEKESRDSGKAGTEPSGVQNTICQEKPDEASQEYPWSKWETDQTRKLRQSSDTYQTMFTDNQTLEEAEKGVTLDPTMKIDID